MNDPDTVKLMTYEGIVRNKKIGAAKQYDKVLQELYDTGIMFVDILWTYLNNALFG